LESIGYDARMQQKTLVADRRDVLILNLRSVRPLLVSRPAFCQSITFFNSILRIS
jgi:hypothetical protein